MYSGTSRSSSTGHQASTSQVLVLFTQTPVISPWYRNKELESITQQWNRQQRGRWQQFQTLSCLHFYLELASTAAYKSKANAEPALSFSLNPNVIASLCAYSFAAIGLSSCVWWACRQSPAGAHSASALWPLCLAAGQSRVYLFLSVEAERLHVTGVSQTDLKLRSDWGRRGKALNWTLGRMKDNKFI